MTPWEIPATVKPLAAEFYRLTGKPLGVTGEVAEYVAPELLGLQLAPARTEGYDALRGEERIQIKGRAYGDKSKSQKLSRSGWKLPVTRSCWSFSITRRWSRGKSGKVGTAMYAFAALARRHASEGY